VNLQTSSCDGRLTRNNGAGLSRRLPAPQDAQPGLPQPLGEQQGTLRTTLTPWFGRGLPDRSRWRSVGDAAIRVSDQHPSHPDEQIDRLGVRLVVLGIDDPLDFALPDRDRLQRVLPLTPRTAVQRQPLLRPRRAHRRTVGTRYRARRVWIGVTAAFAVHVVKADAAGWVLDVLPRRLVEGGRGAVRRRLTGGSAKDCPQVRDGRLTARR